MDKKWYAELQVWQKAMSLTKEIYQTTKLLPEEERFGLISQMRRAAVSIPSNIAEGYARTSTKDYIKFLSIALGSTAEIETQLYICKELGYVQEEQLENIFVLIEEISKMLTAIIVKLTQKTKG